MSVVLTVNCSKQHYFTEKLTEYHQNITKISLNDNLSITILHRMSIKYFTILMATITMFSYGIIKELT